MSNLRQAAQQLVERIDLEGASPLDWHEYTALRAALAEDALQRLTDVQQEIETALAEQCPHGVTDGCKECYVAEQEPVVDCPRCGHCCPQRKPLTDEEIVEAVREADLDWQAGWTLDEHEPNRFATLTRAIERAHGIKGEA